MLQSYPIWTQFTNMSTKGRRTKEGRMSEIRVWDRINEDMSEMTEGEIFVLVQPSNYRIFRLEKIVPVEAEGELAGYGFRMVITKEVVP